MPFSSIAANRRATLEGLAPLRVVDIGRSRSTLGRLVEMEFCHEALLHLIRSPRRQQTKNTGAFLVCFALWELSRAKRALALPATPTVLHALISTRALVSRSFPLSARVGYHVLARRRVSFETWPRAYSISCSRMPD